MTSATTTRAASVFDALGDPNRLQIVTGLCDAGPQSTLQVAHSVTLSRQAATKHLVLLEAVGLVTSSKRGRERIWVVQPTPLGVAGELLASLSDRWDRAIERLHAFVSDDA